MPLINQSECYFSEEFGKIKICCGFGELLARPADMFWTFSKIPPNSAQKADSIMYEIYVLK